MRTGKFIEYLVTTKPGYSLDKYDEIEVYEEVFRDPDFHPFKLLIPIK